MMRKSAVNLGMSQMTAKGSTVCFLKQLLTVNGRGNDTESLVLFQMVQDVVHECILTVSQDYTSCMLCLVLGSSLPNMLEATASQDLPFAFQQV